MTELDIPAGLEEVGLRTRLLAAIPELNPTLDGDGEFVPTFEIAGRKLSVPEEFAARVAGVLAAPANEQALRDRAEAALANLQAAYDGWSGLTAAQKDAALKLSLRVTIALVRLVLRRLDAT